MLHSPRHLKPHSSTSNELQWQTTSFVSHLSTVLPLPWYQPDKNNNKNIPKSVSNLERNQMLARLMLWQKTQATSKQPYASTSHPPAFFPWFGYLSKDYFPIPADNSCDWQVARGNLTIHEAKAKELDPARARQRNSCSLHYLRDKENSVLWHSNSTAMVSHLGCKNRDSDAVYHMIIITTLFR